MLIPGISQKPPLDVGARSKNQLLLGLVLKAVAQSGFLLEKSAPKPQHRGARKRWSDAQGG
jgi:hypothetical protein